MASGTTVAFREIERGMMQDRDERLMRLAGDTIRTPVTQRETFLQAACNQDKDLYDEVSEIVEWEERMGSFMRDPLVGLIDLEGLDRPFKPDEVIANRFEIKREVGDGGMGVVYEAYDRKQEQRIAIKCAKLGYERLPPELRAALKVRHPNVCLVNEIHTAFTDLGNLDFLTMEFLDGETLLTRLSRGRLESNEALKIARQLCDGLAEAHRSGVLHRDLKPANVILSPEKNPEIKELRAVITDFGLAADQDGNTDLIGGTPSYMAPELKQSGQTSAASDVYALGVILYEMVTGQKPFPETTSSNGHSSAPRAPGKLVKRLPGIWDDAILPCLAPNPEKRPSAKQVLAVLDRPPVQPWVLKVAIAALILLAAGAFLWPTIYDHLHPSIRLAILPPQAPPDLAQFSGGMLSDVAEQVKRLQRKAVTISVMPPSEVAEARVSTPEQAAQVLHATHALQLRFSRHGTDIVVEQSLVELAHQTQVSHFSDRYSPQMVGDIPSALTGAISSTLHLARPAHSDEISPSATVAYDRGLSYLARDYYSFDQAITSFQEAVAQDPHSPLPLAGLAEAQLAKYDATQKKEWLDQAQQSLEKAEAINHDSVRVLLAAGRLDLLKGKYPAAMEYYSRILETEPRNILAYQNMAFALDAEGNKERAIQMDRQAIELDPLLYSSYEDFGELYFNRGRYKDAEEQYRKGIKLAPGSPTAYANLGGTLLDEQKYPEAVAALQTSLKIKETPQSLNNLGAAYAFLKQDDLALQNYRHAATLEPGNIWYWLNIGDSERRLGNLAKAKSAYQEGQRLALEKLAANPQHGQTRAFLAYLRARLGDKTGARNDAVWALTVWPGDNQVIRYAVLTYAALGDWDDALKTLELGTPELAEELNVHPDLAEFRQDLRFKEWIDKKHKGQENKGG
jgi:eukaryotic-like serine/threonine-protein kinase